MGTSGGGEIVARPAAGLRRWVGASPWRAAAAAFGILQAVLYASLMPLWDGFDEPFHYSYVQHISQHGRLPRLGKSRLSDEVWVTLQAAPSSHLVKRNIAAATSLEEYRQLSPAERRWLRERVWNTGGRGRTDNPENPANYEAQQAPLAYLALAPVDLALEKLPLPLRVWLLRVVCALGGLALVSYALFGMAEALGMAPLYAWWAWFLTVSTQMYWAATARISNDWLATPLLGLVILAAVKWEERGTRRAAWALAGSVAAAALTRAYYLALIPGMVGMLAWVWGRGARGRRGVSGEEAVRGRALWGIALAALAPVAVWYGRNQVLYGSVLGLQEAVRGVSWADRWAALPTVLRPNALLAAARSCLWTGNNAFLMFSQSTMNVCLGLLGALGVAGAVSMWRRGGGGRKWWIVAGGVALHLAAYGYALVNFTGLSGSAALTATPWYATPALAPLYLALGFLASRMRRGARLLVGAAAVCWTWVLVLTYWAKLIPYYGGYSGGKMTVGALVSWYGSRWGAMREMLDVVGLAPSAVVLPLAGAVSVLGVLLCGKLCLGWEEEVSAGRGLRVADRG